MSEQPSGESGERPAESGGRPAANPPRAWRRLLRAGSPRATRANVLAMVLAAALGFAIIAQVRQTLPPEQYARLLALAQPAAR